MPDHDLSAVHEFIHVKLENLVNGKSSDTFILYALSRSETCDLSCKLSKLESEILKLDDYSKRKFYDIPLTHTVLHILQKEILNQFTNERLDIAKLVFYEDYKKRSEDFIILLKECETILKRA